MRTVPLRVLFGMTVVVFVGQLAVRAGGTEPYPGLFQPAFGVVPQEGGVAVSGRLDIRADYADGHVERLDAEQFLPETRTVPSAVVNAAFGDPDRAHDPETLAWVRSRLALHHTAEPTGLTVTWQRVERRVTDGSSVVQVLRNVQLDLDGSA